MKRPSLIFLIGGCVLIHAGPASAEMRQFANLVYELPTGWHPNGKSDGRQELRYGADDGRCDRCRILLDRGTTGGGPIAAWRDQLAAPGADVTVLGEPKRQQKTIGGRPADVLLRMVDNDGRQMFQAFFALDLPTRNELVLFEGSARDEETLNRSLAVMNADLVPMLEKVGFVSEGAAPLLGPPEPGTLDGPWFGTGVRNRYNGLSGTLELVVDKRLMTFYADGRFFQGIPASGSGPLDLAGLVAAGETGLGNYVRRGEAIELRYVDGDVSHVALTGASALRIGQVTLHPATFPPDGFRFAGATNSVHYTAFGPGVSGGVGSSHSQVFHDDGTFTDSSFTGASGSFDTGGGFTATAESPEGSGRYEVASGLITLIPLEGEPRTTWIILEGEENVIIGGQPVSVPDTK